MNKLIHFISSPVTTLALLMLYAIGLGVATFIEKYTSPQMARFFVYNSAPFFLLQLLLCFNFIGLIWQFDYYKQRKWSMILFHVAFIVILAGAMISYMFGEEGIMHIREGETAESIVVNQRFDQKVPFKVTLKEFRMVRYPGSNSPSSFESDLIIEYQNKQTEQMIYMNNVVTVGPYRLYQSSFDRDEKGTVLSVSNDPVGMYVTYFGYALLIVAMILTLFSPNSRFQQLNRRLKEITSQSKTFLLACMLMIPFSAWSATPYDPLTKTELSRLVPSAPHADKFGRIMVQNPKGRIEPMDTYSDELLRKIYRKTSYEGFTANQILIAILSNPTEMSRLPFIYVDNSAIAERFVKKGNYLCYNNLFDARGDYMLTKELQHIYAKEVNGRTQSDKAILKIDEKINILYALFHHSMLPLFPLEGSSNHKWISPGDDLSQFAGKDSLMVSKIIPWYMEEVRSSLQSGDWKTPDEILGIISVYQNARSPLVKEVSRRVDRELLYNRISVFKWCFRFFLTFGLSLLIIQLIALVSNFRWMKVARLTFIGLIIATFIFQTFGLGLRWSVSGHAPWANAYESMVFVSWSAVFAGLFFVRRSPFTFAISTMLAGFILLVTELNFMDPEITPLVPVLKSYWLMIHVAVIMSGYGFFGVGAFIGILNFLLMCMQTKGNRQRFDQKIAELTIVNEMSLIVGLILMTAGTFFGAVWANESWGRYWGWDPKETWALVTMIVYALVLHARFVPSLRGVVTFNLMSVVALSSVLMTYFGVSYYLSGLHSYGRAEALPMQIITYSGIVVFVLVVVAIWRRRRFYKTDE